MVAVSGEKDHTRDIFSSDCTNQPIALFCKSSMVFKARNRVEYLPADDDEFERRPAASRRSTASVSASSLTLVGTSLGSDL